MIVNKEHILKARENWQKAAYNFKFEIITPYFISVKGSEKEVFAFVPAYGSSNGTIIELTSPPEYNTDKEIMEWASDNDLFCSFINVDNLLEYDERYFVEILDDWIKCKNS
ncbi:hypothetical protein FAZ19_23480 [Sphingobacterium alkalisoli]|uniref:DUF2750 domain-containing protein n=1 Tax=Sphingobacterium alkalisoli TaxID=1874115 RepID=A0A4U0GME6_9SPHI|nr:hypothetical protein [Sphingobacterium alkalisoli]TJY59706.1 hypothetical protein FAZ19_23480 [Sphingobacterium alkalisoli]GGH32949.1 hypothetical protein GCM10011418_46810 [Sphingobacterium alkalisoli]